MLEHRLLIVLPNLIVFLEQFLKKILIFDFYFSNSSPPIILLKLKDAENESSFFECFVVRFSLVFAFRTPAVDVDGPDIIL